MKRIAAKYWWIGAAAFVLAVWLGTLLAFNPIPKLTISYQDYWTWRGTFGDMFGAANCLFSAFVVIGVAYGIVQQREELKEARKSSEDQRFTSYFFYLLDKIETNRQKIKYKNRTGRDAIDHLAMDLSSVDAKQHASLYIMNIYNILKLIDLRNEKDKIGNIDILTGCLSVPELRLIVVFAKTSSNSDFSTLLEKYYQIEDALQKSA